MQQYVFRSSVWPLRKFAQCTIEYVYLFSGGLPQIFVMSTGIIEKVFVVYGHWSKTGPLTASIV